MSPPTQFRDAIVLSGWRWETFNTPERVALALARLGAKVLYCENPVSLFRNQARPLEEIAEGIYAFGPRFLSHRLNRIPLGLSHIQAKLICNQVLRAATHLGLEIPLLIYPWGDFFLPVCREFKRRGFPVVHECFDYPEPGQERHIELSDLTLTLSPTIFHQLRAKYGKKIALIPEVRWDVSSGREAADSKGALGEFTAIPQPRIGYIGPVTNRLNLPLIEEMLSAHPKWHFVHFGDTKCLPLANVHALPWRSPEQLEHVVANLDVGFMPYNCHNNKNFHCMPLKVFDYFSEGLPVVSTPIVNLWEYSDVIYFGDSADELCSAVELALAEPANSPKRARRIAIAREHTIHDLAKSLAQIFGFPMPAESPLVREASV